MMTNSDNLKTPARRDFLRRLPLLLLAGSAVPRWMEGAQGELHVLPQDRIDRLRMDFNASRSKVRLVSVLSPT